MREPTTIPQLPPRAQDSHKGDYGRALLVGGSRGMAGAIGLAGMAALRSGAGLVTLAVPEVILETVAAWEPAYMTVPLVADTAGSLTAAAEERICQLANHASCLGCGPGLGRSREAGDLVARLYQTLPQPMVIDADALVALAERNLGNERPAGPRVWTPHPGEFRRLINATITSREEQESRAVELAATAGVVVLLKGHRTLITDGRQVAHNQTGNPGMATGGAGDVLTGIITALICQGMGPWDAAVLGAHVHGLAGDLAADEIGQVSLIARDLIAFLPAAFRRVGTASCS